MTDASPARGRPRTFDSAQVARTGVRLFDEAGFDAVTMADVAAATGVSRRALFTYFPTKAHLLWSGSAAFTANLRDGLASLRTAPLDAGSIAACTAAAYDGPEPLDRDLARSSLRIVLAHPETAVVGQPVLVSARGVLGEHLRRHAVDDFAAECLAGALTSVCFDAATRWAQEPDAPGALEALLREAVGSLGLLTTGG